MCKKTEKELFELEKEISAMNLSQVIINLALSLVLENGTEKVAAADLEAYSRKCKDAVAQAEQKGEIPFLSAENHVDVLRTAKVFSKYPAMTLMAFIKKDMPLHGILDGYRMAESLLTAMRLIQDGGEVLDYKGASLSDIAEALSADIWELEAYGLVTEEEACE